MLSNHYMNERIDRESFIRQIGLGHIIHEIVVDHGHRNGAERYQITDNAIIIVRNARTDRLITKLIARPNQIRRYYPDAPQALINLAREHQKKGWNEV